MNNQHYSGKNLYRFSNQRERRDYVLKSGTSLASTTKITKEELIAKLDDICESIYDGTYTFNLTFHDDLLTNSHPHGSVERLGQDLIMRNLKENLCKIYSARQAHRQMIIGFIKDYLTQHLKIKDYQVVILRIDIRKFYPSINREHVFHQLKESARLSAESILLLKDILSRVPSGLPLGTSVSAPLSEYAMVFFDKAILQTTGVLYYKRYVDDIVIICSNDTVAEKLWNDVPVLLDKLKLEINRKKSKKIVFGKNIPATFVSNGYIRNQLSFLGYRIEYNGHGDLKVHISDGKIKDFKTKIVTSLLNWKKNHDFKLLCMRLKFLTGNCIFINIKDSVPTFSGLKYNYPHLTDDGKMILLELDHFLQMLVNSRNMSFRGSFSSSQIRTLKKFSFKGGFEKNIFHKFSPRQMKEIKRIW